MTINREQVLEKELYKVTLILNEIKEMLNKTDMESIPMYGLVECIRLKVERANSLESQLTSIVNELNLNFQMHNLNYTIGKLTPYMGTDITGIGYCADLGKCSQILINKLKPKTL